VSSSSPTTETDQALTDVRALAREWLGLITGLFGLTGLSSLIFVRDPLSGVDPTWQVFFAIAALIFALSLIGATIAANVAAHGMPLRKNRGQDSHKHTREEAVDCIRIALGSTVVALAALGFCIWILWFGPEDATPLQVLATSESHEPICGSVEEFEVDRVVINDGGKQTISDNDGPWTFEVVDECPD
jgi:amino acid transporter